MGPQPGLRRAEPPRPHPPPRPEEELEDDDPSGNHPAHEACPAAPPGEPAGGEILGEIEAGGHDREQDHGDNPREVPMPRLATNTHAKSPHDPGPSIDTPAAAPSRPAPLSGPTNGTRLAHTLQRGTGSGIRRSFPRLRPTAPLKVGKAAEAAPLHRRLLQPPSRSGRQSSPRGRADASTGAGRLGRVGGDGLRAPRRRDGARPDGRA